jgi:hypothetical protein
MRLFVSGSSVFLFDILNLASLLLDLFIFVIVKSSKKVDHLLLNVRPFLIFIQQGQHHFLNVGFKIDV